MQLLVEVKKVDYRSWPNLEKTGQCFQDEALFSESELSDQLGICKLGKKITPMIVCKEGKSLSEWQAGNCNSREIYSLLLNEFQNVFNGRTGTWNAMWTVEQLLAVVYCHLTIYSPFSKAITCACDG